MNRVIGQQCTSGFCATIALPKLWFEALGAKRWIQMVYCSTQQHNEWPHMFREILYSVFLIFWGCIKHLSSTRKESGTIKASTQACSPHCVCGSGSRFIGVIMEAQWVHCNTSTHSLCHLTYFMCQSHRGRRKRLYVCLHQLCTVTSSIHQYNVLSACVLYLPFYGKYCLHVVTPFETFVMNIKRPWGSDRRELMFVFSCFASVPFYFFLTLELNLS